MPKLKVLLVQFAVLYRGEEKVQMSTRSGEFVTLRQLRSEVGKDAARFFYVMRRSEQHMDFDLKLATSRVGSWGMNLTDAGILPSRKMACRSPWERCLYRD